LRLIPNRRHSVLTLASRAMEVSMNCFHSCMGDVSYQAKAHLLARTVTHVSGRIVTRSPTSASRSVTHVSSPDPSAADQFALTENPNIARIKIMPRRSAQLSVALRPRPRWGGARDGAGRKPGPSPRLRHGRRVHFAQPLPAHVTLRMRDDVPSLRTVPIVREIETTFARGCERPGFRLVHYSAPPSR
jgi:hypothetical protein